MNIPSLQNLIAVVIATGLFFATSHVSAQEAKQPLPASVAQVLQMAQSDVEDATIIAYVKNSGLNFGLTPAHIIQLRQQGLSNEVISAMLGQSKGAAVAVAPTASYYYTYPQLVGSYYYQPYTYGYPYAYAGCGYYPNYGYSGWGWGGWGGWGWGGHHHRHHGHYGHHGRHGHHGYHRGHYGGHHRGYGRCH